MMSSPTAGVARHPLVTLLTPTYNDAGHLPVLIGSVLGQDYANWEWIIVDDGSSDDTPRILEGLSDPRIRVLRKENDDQLNALAHARPHIRGDVVSMIHSDDEFVSSQSVSRAVEHLLQSGADGLYADFQTMDGQGRPTGELKTPDALTSALAARTVVQMGTNFVGDPFFVRRAAFDSHIVPNYISQNTIYYFDYQGSNALRLVKTGSWYRYRVFAENYIRSDIGKFVALSGQFRTVSRLVNAGICPAVNVIGGYAWFRLARRLNLQMAWPRLAPGQFGSSFFGFWASDLNRHGYPELLATMARAIAHSYSVRGVQRRPRLWQPDPGLSGFGPADSRRFFREHEAGHVSDVSLSLLDQDFDHIVVRSELAREQVKGWLNFFSLQYPVVEQAS
jgi:glycosyltransferase involved in cell wall biosynthesis